MYNHRREVQGDNGLPTFLEAYYGGMESTANRRRLLRPRHGVLRQGGRHEHPVHGSVLRPSGTYSTGSRPRGCDEWTSTSEAGRKEAVQRRGGLDNVLFTGHGPIVSDGDV